MDYILPVSAEYNENCEYKSSQIKKNLPIINESQEVTIFVTSEKELITIGENYPLTVRCVLKNNNDIPVRLGYITINDLSTKCYLDNDGRTKINYKPLETGNDIPITITYHDDTNLFESTSTTFLLEVHKIATNLEIIECNEFIADFDEDVTIKVQVKDDNGEEITYGRVTFLHYLYYPDSNNIAENRIEKIIGNPVYLDENGEAFITYSPMQDYEEDEDIANTLANNYKDFYVEYIRPVYNYNKNSSYNDNNDNDIKWKYYGESDDVGYIYIKRPNTIIIKGFVNNQEITNRNYIDYIEAQDPITIKVYVDNDSDNITFKNNDIIELIVEGTVVTPKSTNINSTDFDQYVSDHYTFTEIDSFTVDAEYESGNVFSATLNNLAPGYYDIYVKSNIEYDVDSNVHQYSQTTDIKDDGKKYLQFIEESMHYYLQVKYNASNNINISFNQQEYLTKVNEPINNLIVTVSNLTNNQLNLLLNKKCFLHTPETTLPYEANLTRNNNTLQAQFNNVVFTSIQDASIYAHIDSVMTNNEYIPNIYTNNALVIVEGEKESSLSVQVKQTDYPGIINYTVSLTGIKSGIYTGELYNYTNANNKGESIDFNFDAFDSTYNGIISALPTGQYTTEFNVNNTTKTQNYTINKARISHTNSTEITGDRTIVGVPNKITSIVLSSSGENLSNFNINKLHVYIKQELAQEYEECQITNYTLTDDNKNMIVSFYIGAYDEALEVWNGIYTEDTWNLKINIDNDDNFIHVINDTTFQTTLKNPDFLINEDEDNNITIRINNPQTEYIPLLIKLRNNDTYKNFIGVTDLNGVVTLLSPENKDIWNSLNIIEITTNPTNEDLIELLQTENIQPSELIYDDFENVFYGKYINEDEMILNEDDEDDSFEEDTYFEEDESFEVNEPLEGESSEEEPSEDEPSEDEPFEDDEPFEPEIIPQEEVILAGLCKQLSTYQDTYLFTYYKQATKSYYRNIGA